MIVADKFTSADLALMPDNGKRYEIIEGELYVSRQPGVEHQHACAALTHYLYGWNLEHGLGKVLGAPGVIFAEDDDVAPDLIWISNDALAKSLDKAGHIHTAPELVIEVISPGKTNADRDRQAKLRLYSRRGVQEYWIVDWLLQKVEIYRRKYGRLKQVETLLPQDEIKSPLLPGFSCQVKLLFFSLPK